MLNMVLFLQLLSEYLSIREGEWCGSLKGTHLKIFLFSEATLNIVNV